MEFRLLATLTALVCAILFVFLLVAGSSYTAIYGVTSDPSAGFMARRAAPLLGGLAVLLWMARGAGASDSRRAIAAGVCVVFAGIAVTGIYEFSTGYAASTILVAAAGELLIAVLFLPHLRVTAPA